jgi:hypothetical protein
MSANDLLDEKIIYQNGRFQRVRRWWKGAHPDRGTITHGWTGWETVEERERILPVRIFVVKDI